ncbi:MAG: hypothetical protein L6R35_006227 [Caloplaca aegaea]|nr:MAG: hypothetical protein L6R35_006227 [Caloplaca aegaea]
MDLSNNQSKRRFLIDGYPRSMDQALTFEEEIHDHNAVICLDCSDDEMLRRLRKRAESSGRIDDNPEAFKKRLDTYQKESTPVMDHLRKRGSVKMGFTLIADYDPFASADDIERIHGILQARKRARDNTFAIAKKARRRRWTPGSEECYRKVFAKAGLEREFDEEVVNRDIQGADAQALEQSELDEGLSMTLLKVRETDQTIAEHQLLINNMDHQDFEPPQDGKVDEFQEWITVNKDDT